MVFVNGRQTEFDEEPMLDFRGVSVMRLPNTSTVDVIFKSGISLRVEGHRELLGFQLLIPKMFKGNELCRRFFSFELQSWARLFEARSNWSLIKPKLSCRVIPGLRRTLYQNVCYAVQLCYACSGRLVLVSCRPNSLSFMA